MCGIVGAFLHGSPCLKGLVEGLRVLEYRGYDSVGVGVVQGDRIEVRRKAGRIEEVEKLLAAGDLDDVEIGIGHSRWATHGPPTDANAHPHADTEGRLVVVHNGILENYATLREELQGQGIRFRSDTDTEVLAHLISRELDRGDGSLSAAVRAALAQVKGYYAVAVLAHLDGPQLVCSREGPPICVAATENGAWLASDALAILPHTRDVVYLDELPRNPTGKVLKRVLREME